MEEAAPSAIQSPPPEVWRCFVSLALSLSLPPLPSVSLSLSLSIQTVVRIILGADVPVGIV